MRSLITANPTITVHQLAVAMGYSEDRSIYYWLRKAGHKGLRDFKAEVLSRSTYERDSGGATSHLAEETGAESSHAVYVVQSSEYIPWLFPGDRLILDQGLPLETGRLVLVRLKTEPGALRRYIQGPPDLLIHPTNPRLASRLDGTDGLSIVGVARMIRDLP